MKKQFLLFLFALLPMLAMADDSGSCGTNVTYTFVSSTGTLTIQGSGAMTNYFFDSYIPWYSYKNDIKTVIIEEGVTSIGNNAFYNCSGLTSVTIPNSVTSIGTRAFSVCSGLTSVSIPNSVTSIGYAAFTGCSGLTSITIPNSVTNMGQNSFSSSDPNSSVFDNCYNLETIIVEAGNKVFDSRDNCNAIIESASNKLIAGCKTTIIPNTVTSIGNYAFYGCSGLTSVNIPNSVTNIGVSAFYGCSGLTSITIPDGVTSIGSGAFCECSGLTSVTIPDGVTSIGNSAFSGCSGLISVNIPNGVTSIGNSAFSGCSGLQKVIVPNIAAWCGFSFLQNSDNPLYYAHHIYSDENTEITDLEIPNGVTSIGNYAFSGCSGLTSVNIPNSVTSIGDCAFRGCSGFQKVIVPNIAAWCGFSFLQNSDNPLYYAHHIYSDENTEITDLDIPNGVTSIGSYALSGCSGLTSVTIPNSVSSIGNSAFYGCSGLISVNIPNSVTSIGRYAFDGCSGLQKVIVPNIAAWCGFSFLQVSDNPLYYAHHIYSDENTEITDLEIPNGVTSIGSYTFYNCSGLTSVNIPNSVTSIGDSAFEGCSGLTSITIPNSELSIGRLAFSYCSGLTSITLPNRVKSIGLDAFSYCTGLTSVNINIPNSVTSIDNRAFYGCSGLTSVEFHCGQIGLWFGGMTSIEEVTIGNEVRMIDNYAFRHCSGLTSVTIPNSVTSIGQEAFRHCSGLTSVKSKIETPFALAYAAFGSISNTCILTVPKGTRDAYIAAGWTEDVFKGGVIEESDDIIVFADANVKAICVANWDTDGDGELSYDEAEAVTSIGTVFRNNTSITSFDEFAYFTGVTSIGLLAFDGCSQLASITLPVGLTTINGYAFRGCALTAMSIPSTVTFIEGNFLADCDAIAQITVDNGNTTFDSRNNCNAIIVTNDVIDPYNTSFNIYDSNTLLTGCKNTSIPNTVTKIGHEAFYGCSGLTSITIPSSVIRIEGGAFHGCSGLTSITIPSNVTDIDNNINLFGKCDALTSIIVENGNTKYDSRNGCNAIIETSTNTLVSACNSTVIPNDITSIGVGAFGDCTEMTSITIPNSVTNIESYAFRGCSSLASINVESGNTVFDSRNNCNAIIHTASNTLIAGCKNTVIPNSVTSIEGFIYGAFESCSSLTSITIPNSVTSIGRMAFHLCSGLTSVTVDINTPLSITDETFSNRANATLYVPRGCRSAYEAADYWKEFGTIEEMDPESVTITLNSLGKGTYCSEYPLDFTGVSGIAAYIICGFKPSAGNLSTLRVFEVPEETGLYIVGTPGSTYNIPVAPTDFYYTSMMKGITVATVIPANEDGYTNYVLASNGNGGVFFKRANNNSSPANRAYVQIPSSTAGAREFLGIELDDDSTTGLDGVITSDTEEAEGDYYNLSGQKVQTPRKGIYIKNGKKIFIH